MQRGPYKTYLEPESLNPIPPSTARSKRKREQSSSTTSDTSSQESIDEYEEQNRETNQYEPSENSGTSSEIQNNEEFVRNIEATDSVEPCGRFDSSFEFDSSEEEQEQEEYLQDDAHPPQENDEDEWYDAEYSTDDDEILPDNVQDNCEENEMRNEYAELDQKLCACTSTTVGEALIMAILIGKKYSLPWVAIIDIINLVNKIFDRDVIRNSKYRLFKYFPANETSLTYHIFCTSCEKYICQRQKLRFGARVVCDNCHCEFDETLASAFFVTLNLSAQLQNLLENSEIQKHLDYRYSRQKKNYAALEDILDGNMYKQYCTTGGPLDSPHNFSYTFNTDGCQAANSSNVSIWPIYLMLNELPPKVRSKNMLLAGLWVHKREPNMNMFMKPFVDEANVLANEGVNWKVNEQCVTSKFFPICCCVDSVARPCLLNMIRFNGHYGCTFCDHPSEAVEGYRKYPVSTNVPADRTDESIRLSMQNVSEHDIYPENSKGVKGPSVLMNLQGFNLADGMVADYMHSVLLGVTRQYTEILLTSPGKEYYVGTPNELAVINKRLLSIQPPTCITRVPRALQERKNWKASEWRSWLVWYSLLCLRNLLPTKYLKHLALLVTAIHTFLQDSITETMINGAHVLLIKFVVQFQEYFGKSAMTYNVHLLLHISTGVRNWGPLWTHNAFCFENENRFVLQMKTSPHLIATQIAKRFLFYKQISRSIGEIARGNRFLEFCEDSLEQRLKYTHKIDDCTLIGCGEDYNLNPDEAACFGRQLKCTSYKKMIYRGLRWTTELYKRAKKTNNSVIITDTTRGILSNICVYNNDENDRTQTKIIIFFRKITILQPVYISSSHVTVTHIQQCSINRTSLNMCDITCLVGQALKINVNDKMYISDIPRGCFGD